MNATPIILVLYGGVGSEREVSLRSGQAVAQALRAGFDVEALILEREALPESIRRLRPSPATCASPCPEP
jgi:hypothetical protein